MGIGLVALHFLILEAWTKKTGGFSFVLHPWHLLTSLTL